MRFKYSMMTSSLANQGLGAREIVDASVELGFSGIDWLTNYEGCPEVLSKEKPEDLRRMCEDAGLPVVGYIFFADDFIHQRPDWQSGIHRAMEKAVILGAPQIMFATCPLSWASDRADGHEKWKEAIAVMMQDAEELHLVPTVENYPGALSPLVLAGDFLDWQREFPGLQLCFDNGNAAGGEDPVEGCRKILPWLRHVHLKDWLKYDEPGFRRTRMLDGRYYYPALIGEGEVSPEGVLKLLAENGYDGYINLEYEDHAIPPVEAMRRALAYLNRITAEW